MEAETEMNPYEPPGIPLDEEDYCEFRYPTVDTNALCIPVFIVTVSFAHVLIECYFRVM